MQDISGGIGREILLGFTQLPSSTAKILESFFAGNSSSPQTKQSLKTVSTAPITWQQPQMQTFQQR